MITIRGHHLLCIHGFRGMGYSETFVKEMEKIVFLFRDDPTNLTLKVKIVNDFDDVCQGCPNNGLTRCLADDKSGNHVTTMDQRVLAKLGLQQNDMYTKQELLLATQERIEPDDLEKLCEGCSWLSYGVCKEGIIQLKQRQI